MKKRNFKLDDDGKVILYGAITFGNKTVPKWGNIIRSRAYYLKDSGSIRLAYLMTKNKITFEDSDYNSNNEFLKHNRMARLDNVTKLNYKKDILNSLENKLEGLCNCGNERKIKIFKESIEREIEQTKEGIEDLHNLIKEDNDPINLYNIYDEYGKKIRIYNDRGEIKVKSLNDKYGERIRVLKGKVK